MPRVLLQVPSLSAVPLDHLWNRYRLRGLIVDWDNTLAEPLAATWFPGAARWCQEAQRAGWRIVVLSNGNRRRLQTVSHNTGLPAIGEAKKPWHPDGYRQALQLLHLSAPEVLVIGDQVLTDVLGAVWHGLNAVVVAPPYHRETTWSRRLRWLDRLLKASIIPRSLP